MVNIDLWSALKDIYKLMKKRFFTKESEYEIKEETVEFSYAEEIKDKVGSEWVPVWSNPVKVKARVEKGTHEIYYDPDHKKQIKVKIILYILIP